MTYFHIYSSTMSPCSWDHEHLARVQLDWLCPGCSAVRKCDAPVDVILNHKTGIDKPLTFMAGGSPGIIWKDLLGQLPSEVVAKDMLLGNVFGPGAERLDGWSTFVGRRQLIIRGTNDASYRICDVCGRYVYFATGKRYLFPEPTGAEIYSSNPAGLVIPKSMYYSLDLKKWKKRIYVDKLEIPKSPSDGLGILGSESSEFQ